MRVLIILVALIAFLLPAPGILLASSELVLSRNLLMGWIMLLACLIAALSAVLWACSALNKCKVHHGIWLFTYVASAMIGFYASENMVFKFMM